MLLAITHRTAYRYELPIHHSKNEVRALPVSDAHQRCLRADLEVSPEATFPLRWRDYFGTEVVAFDIDGPHDGVEVVASATVASHERTAETLLDGWGTVEGVELDQLDDLDAAEFLLPSPLVELDGQARELAAGLAAPGSRPGCPASAGGRWTRPTTRPPASATSRSATAATTVTSPPCGGCTGAAPVAGSRSRCASRACPTTTWTTIRATSGRAECASRSAAPSG